MNDALAQPMSPLAAANEALTFSWMRSTASQKVVARAVVFSNAVAVVVVEAKLSIRSAEAQV